MEPPTSAPPCRLWQSFQNRLLALGLILGILSAAPVFGQQFRRGPAAAQAADRQGLAASRQGHAHLARQKFKQATQLDPAFAPAWLHWGIALAAQQRYAEAVERFQQAVHLRPQDATAWKALGMAAGKAGNRPLAIAAMQQLVAIEPHSSSAHLNLGIALADGANLNDALTEMTTAARLAPASSVAHYNRARVLYAMERKPEARQEAQQAVRLNPRNADALYLLALLEPDPAESTRRLQEVVAIRPGDADARSLLASHLLQQGHPHQAQRQWRRALRIHPNLPAALYGMARVLGQQNDARAALYLQRFRALQQQQKSTDRVHTLGNFAISAAQQGHWQEAMTDMRQALQICGDCPEQEQLHKNFGLLLCRKGDLSAGIAELRRAYALNPRDPDVVRSLQILKARPEPPTHE